LTIHRVPEGYVGTYTRGGALLMEITEPGFHLKLPLVTQFNPVQVLLSGSSGDCGFNGCVYKGLTGV
jgi:regulator of protease activity HflC (stomatin/prohibitin superfamily)